MPNTDQAIADLRRLVDAAQESYRGHGDSVALSSFIYGMVLPPLRDILSDIVLSLHRPDPYPERFIHYTSLSNIVSMFEQDQGRIRLYDANQSNDPLEGKYLTNALQFPDNYNWIDDAHPSSFSAKSYAYTASFIATLNDDSPQDNLTYWRTYGKEGAGCSLELVKPPPNLRSVLYGEDAVAATRDALLPIVEVLDPLAKVHTEAGRSVSEAFWEALDAVRYLYKDKPYGYEQECRYIIADKDVDDEEVRFDARGSAVFPSRVRHYCTTKELDLHTHLSTSDASITLGPSMNHVAPDVDELIRSLRLLLKKHGLEGVSVTPSSISYRQM